MKASDPLLAKSWDSRGQDEQLPTFARLVPHLRAVERAGESIVEIAGEQLSLSSNCPREPHKGLAESAYRHQRYRLIESVLRPLVSDPVINALRHQWRERIKTIMKKVIESKRK